MEQTGFENGGISNFKGLMTSVFFVNDDEHDDKNDENILNYRRRD